MAARLWAHLVDRHRTAANDPISTTSVAGTRIGHHRIFQFRGTAYIA